MPNVNFDKTGVPTPQRGLLLEPGAERMEIVNDSYANLLSEESFDEMAANKASSTSDEHTDRL